MTVPPASSQALAVSLNTQPLPLHAFMPLHAFFGVWQSLLPLQLFAWRQCTLPVCAANGVTDPAKASDTAAIAKAVPALLLFFI